MSTKKFSATITTRYGQPEENIYEQVIELVKKNNLPKSRAQLLLVERGLQHTNNPKPIVKEKVVYRDKIKEVPLEKIVEKVVYQDRSEPKPEPKHLGEGIQEHIQGDPPKSGQHSSADKLMTQDKADPPVTALEEKKSADWVVPTVIGGGLIVTLLYLIFR